LVRGTIGFGVRMLRVMFTRIMRNLPIQPEQLGRVSGRHTKARRWRLSRKLLMSLIGTGAITTG